MKVSTFSKILIFITLLLFLLQLFIIIDFACSTGNVLPYAVNLFAVTYQQSNDVFLAVPNFFLIPLLILIFNVVIGKKKDK